MAASITTIGITHPFRSFVAIPFREQADDTRLIVNEGGAVTRPDCSRDSKRESLQAIVLSMSMGPKG